MAMTAPNEVSRLLESGKRHYRDGAFGAAANDFSRALEIEPGNTEAREFLTIIDDIQNYRYTDLLNP